MKISQTLSLTFFFQSRWKRMSHVTAPFWVQITRLRLCRVWGEGEAGGPLEKAGFSVGQELGGPG